MSLTGSAALSLFSTSKETRKKRKRGKQKEERDKRGVRERARGTDKRSVRKCKKKGGGQRDTE